MNMWQNTQFYIFFKYNYWAFPCMESNSIESCYCIRRTKYQSTYITNMFQYVQKHRDVSKALICLNEVHSSLFDFFSVNSISFNTILFKLTQKRSSSFDFVLFSNLMKNGMYSVNSVQHLFWYSKASFRNPTDDSSAMILTMFIG